MIPAQRKQAIRDGLQALGLSLLVHLLLLGLIVLGTWDWQPFERELPPVRVTLVDTAPLVAERRAAEEAERQAELERQAALARERQEAERRRQEQERERQRRQQELERREAELARQREQERERREADLQRQREAEEQRRRADEERRQAEEARQREIEELRRQREEAQRRREEEEQRMRELAERRAAEQAEREAAAEAERLRLADERAAEDARLATLGEEYIITIRALVTRNWNRPPTTRPGVECTVRVFQIPGGEIISAEIVRPCNADEATRRSIVAAVMRVGELPYRGYESVFQRQIDFIFRYDG